MYQSVNKSTTTLTSPPSRAPDAQHEHSGGRLHRRVIQAGGDNISLQFLTSSCNPCLLSFP